MKILDCFPYFNEVELLELRLRLLWDKVDQFIITDADRTFSGIPKDFTCKKTLAQLGLYDESKVTVIEVEMPGEENDGRHWEREYLQRDIAAQYITEGTVALVSDCDEIVDPDQIEVLCNTATVEPKNLIRVPMHFLCSRADLEVEFTKLGPSRYRSAMVCLPHHVKETKLSILRESASNPKPGNTHSFFNCCLNSQIASPAGWHFSWMGDAARRKSKFISFSHRTDYIPNTPYTNEEDMLSFMDDYQASPNSPDALGREDHILVPFDTSKLPREVFEYPHIREYLLPE